MSAILCTERNALKITEFSIPLEVNMITGALRFLTPLLTSTYTAQGRNIKAAEAKE